MEQVLWGLASTLRHDHVCSSRGPGGSLSNSHGPRGWHPALLAPGLALPPTPSSSGVPGPTEDGHHRVRAGGLGCLPFLPHWDSTRSGPRLTPADRGGVLTPLSGGDFQEMSLERRYCHQGFAEETSGLVGLCGGPLGAHTLRWLLRDGTGAGVA